MAERDVFSLSLSFFYLLLFLGLAFQQELPSVSGVSDSKRFVLSAATFDLFRKVGEHGKSKKLPNNTKRERTRERERGADLSKR